MDRAGYLLATLNAKTAEFIMEVFFAMLIIAFDGSGLF